MVGAAAAVATAQMVSLIPVVTTTGIVWKMTEAMMPKPGGRSRGKPRSRDIYSREYSGNFSNVGF